MNPRRSCRGLTLTEMLVVMAIAGAVMAAVMGIMVSGTRSFAREQGQTYTQFRVRTALDDMAKDIRVAVAVASSSGLPSNTGAITLQVPCRNAGGIMYSGSPPSADTMLKDTVSYYVKDGVLSRKTTVGNGASLRVGGTVVVAQHVSALTFQMKTVSGTNTTDVTKAAEVDVSATVGGAGGLEARTVALTGVRLRNRRSPVAP